MKKVQLINLYSSFAISYTCWKCSQDVKLGQFDSQQYKYKAIFNIVVDFESHTFDIAQQMS